MPRGILWAGAAFAAAVFLAFLIVWPSLSRVFEANQAQRRFDLRFPGWRTPAQLSAGDREKLLSGLIGALKDPDEAVRKKTCYALDLMGPEAKAAASALLEAVDRPDWGTSNGATAALESIAGLSVPDPVRLKWTPEALRWRARKALLAIGTPEAAAAASRLPANCPSSLSRVGWCG